MPARRLQGPRPPPALIATVALLLAALASWATPPSEAVAGTIHTGLSSAELESLDRLQRELEQLKHRIQGMEGKLKDSANARKSADQARMQAERRLAKAIQDAEQTSADLQSLKATSSALEQELSLREDRIKQLDADLKTARRTSGDLQDRLTNLQNRTPITDGGLLSETLARQASADAAARLLQARKHSKDSDPAEAAHRIRTAEIDLRHHQRRLAMVIDAQSLYQVRANDTLAQISNRFYRSGSPWRPLFEANRHVLANPDRLEPGVTLVIP